MTDIFDAFLSGFDAGWDGETKGKYTVPPKYNLTAAFWHGLEKGREKAKASMAAIERMKETQANREET